MKYIIFSLASLLTIVNVSCKNNSVEALANGNICDTSSTKYSTTISKIMTNHCTNCHGGSNPSAGISLEGYANVSQFANASLQRMNSSTFPMPPSGKIDDCNINKLSAWIAKGKQNN